MYVLSGRVRALVFLAILALSSPLPLISSLGFVVNVTVDSAPSSSQPYPHRHRSASMDSATSANKPVPTHSRAHASASHSHSAPYVIPSSASQSLPSVSSLPRPLFGTAFNVLYQKADPVHYGPLVARISHVIVPENEMNHYSTEWQGPGQFYYADADAFMDYAVKNNLLVRGHILIWTQSKFQAPWLAKGVKDFAVAQRRDLMHNHVAHVLTHFASHASRIPWWDTVNEAFTSVRLGLESPWIDLYDHPLDFVAEVFRTARRKAAPHVKLFYNDFDNHDMGAASTAQYEWILSLKQQGVPVDGVGIQAHLELPPDGVSFREEFQRNMERYAALGLEVHVTELDVRLPTDDAKGLHPRNHVDLARQARVYQDMLEACQAVSQCTVLVVWGLAYHQSWIPAFFPGEGAATTFDQNYTPTPAWDVLSPLAQK